MKTKWVLVLVLATAWALVPAALADPVPGQVDTFQDGTAANWFTGGGPGSIPPTPPPVISTGGPAGSGDAFMSLIALGGSGPGSRLNVTNATQWAGDYLAAGVTAIEMHLNNQGITDLSLRLGFADPIPGPPTNAAFSTQAVFVPAGSGWIQRIFPIGPGDLTAFLGDVNAALMNATTVHLYHSPTPNFPNSIAPIPAIAANLGVDNIRAVPEPSVVFFCGACAPMLVARAVRRRPRLPAGRTSDVVAF